MRQPSRRWFMAALCGAAALAVTGSMIEPASAAGGRRVVKTRFFEGTTSTEGEQRTLWLAVDGTRVFGLAVPEGSLEGFRLQGKLTGTSLSGNLFNDTGAQAGTFTGTLDGAAVSGTYTLDGVEGQFSAAEATRDKTRMNTLKGGYRDLNLRDEGIDLTINLKKNGTAGGQGFITDPIRIKAATLNGKWMVDSNGQLWWLPLKFQVDSRIDAPDLPLFRQNTVLKLNYVLQGRKLTLSNVFDGSTLAELRKK